jgi:amino acid permease
MLNSTSDDSKFNYRSTQAVSKLCHTSTKHLLEPKTSLFNWIEEGSSLSAITILLASSFGATIVLVPNSIYDLGIYFGVFLLLLAMLINLFSSYCLIVVSERTGIITYKGLGDTLYSCKHGILFEVLMVISCFNKVVLYIIHLGKIIAFNFSGYISAPWIWYLVMAICLFPEALVRYISKLRYFVILSIIGVVMYTCTIISETLYGLVHSEFNIDYSIFTKNPLEPGYYLILRYFVEFLVCFNCQSNILSVYEGTDYKSIGKGVNLVLASYSIPSGLYIILGIMGSLILFRENSGIYDILKENNNLYPLVYYI